MFQEKASRNRKLIAINCKSLLTECQKFSFSPDGTLLAAGNKDGCRVSVMQLICDSKGSLCELVLICICYRGFFSSNLKQMTFSPDNDFLLVTSDTGKVAIFNIGSFVSGKNNLRTVRKNEIKACMNIVMDDLLKQCKLPKKEFKTLSSIKIALKQLGNVSVPGSSFVCGLARESVTQRDQYII